MNRNNLWRFVLVVLVVLWSLYELYPPQPRDLLLVFREKSQVRDTNFTAILRRAQDLQKTMPEKPYDHIQIELKWHDRWKDADFYKAEENSAKPKFYVLDMFP